MSTPIATRPKFLSWDDLRDTWHGLLSNRAGGRDEVALLPLAKKVFDALNRLQSDISDAGRAYLFALNYAGAQRVWDQANAWKCEAFESHAARVERFHSQMRVAITVIDPSFSLDRLPKRGVRTGSVNQHCNWMRISEVGLPKRLCEALHRTRYSVYILQARALHDAKAADCSNLIDRLSQQAYNFSLLAYFTQESFRTYVENLPPSDAKREQLAMLIEWEIKNLWYAAQAADEAGYHATSAALGAKLLDYIDRRYHRDRSLSAEVQKAVNGTCDSVRAIGYGIPMNFRDGGKFATKPRARVVDPDQARGSERSGSSVSPPKRDSTEPSEKTDSGPRNKSREYRIYREVPRQALSDFVSAAGGSFRINARPLPLIGFVVDRAASLPTHSVRQELFDACIQLDQLRLAFQMLRDCTTWIPSASSLAQLARHLMVAQRLMPGAIRGEKQKEWLDLLASAWASVPTKDWQDVRIDQGLLGHMTSLAMGSGNTSPDALLVGKQNDRNVLSGDRYFKPLVDVETPDDIQTSVRDKLAGTHTVVLSAAPRGQSLDLYAEASEYGRRRGTISPDRVSAAKNSLESARKLMKSSCLLDPTLRNNSAFKPVVDLVEDFVLFIRSCDPDCSLLMLAIEPRLARLPWNVLMKSFIGASAPVVTLVPSLSWFRDYETISEASIADAKFSDDHRRRNVLDEEKPPPVPRFQAATVLQLTYMHPERAADYSRLRNAAQEMTLSLDPICNTVVAHGRWDENAKMTTVMGPNGNFQTYEWVDFFSTAVAMILSCEGGATTDHLLADLAGLPGLGLAIGCRCVVAPVTKLSPGDLADLCGVLADPTAGTTLFHRLKTAFDKFPATRQVAVFGDPMIVL